MWVVDPQVGLVVPGVWGTLGVFPRMWVVEPQVRDTPGSDPGIHVVETPRKHGVTLR